MSGASRAAAAAAAIDACGVVGILRGDFTASLDRLLEALLDGGVTAIEISLTSPRALDLIARAVARAGSRATIGAGTVMTADDVADVYARGAAFVVSPIVDPAVIGAALELDVMPLPGAYTPTEAVYATRLGAPAVKLFPADALGPAFVKAIRAPLPHLKLVPTGGVTLDLASAFARAGAWAIGVGTPLVGPAGELDMDAVAARARAFVRAMRPA